MKDLNLSQGDDHLIDRATIYEDVIKLYQEGTILKEFPIFIKFQNEMAVDLGGVQREMFSAFWEKAYQALFEGATTLIPMIHPQTDISLFPIIGRIISHGYLVAGVLPLRLALPTLATMLLGPTVTVPGHILLDSFLDYINSQERTILKNAIKFEKKESYPTALQDLMNILSGFGCRMLPTPSTLMQLIEQVARYEFLTKPSAGIALINSGIPESHKSFWSRRTVEDIKVIYQQLAVSSQKVLSLLSFPDACSQQEERVAGYLRTMLGNMQPEELRMFMRYISGSCVCSANNITISFNSLSGLARRPIAHTCNSTLELPTSYLNYDDFHLEFKAIFSQTNNDFSWRMDAI